MKKICVAALTAVLLTGCSVNGLAVGTAPSKEERYVQALKDRGLPLKDGVDPEKAKEAALMACDMISADIPQWVIAEQMTEQTELDASQALAFLSVTRSFYCPERGSS